MNKIIIHRNKKNPIIQNDLEDRIVYRPKIGFSFLDLYRTSEMKNLDVVENEIIFRIVNFLPKTKKRLFHKTNSIDFAYVLEGQIELILEQQEIILKKGDSVIQEANNHAWINHEEYSCKVLFVLTSLNRYSGIPNVSEIGMC